MFERIFKRNRMLLSEAASFVAYVDGVPIVRPATQLSYRSAVRTVIEALGRDPLVTDISPALLFEWSEWLNDSMGIISANSRRRALRSILNKLQQRGMMERSFSEHIRLKPEPPKSIKAITEENKNLMVDAAPIKWRAIIEVLWSTGCRRGGLLSMRLNDFHVREEGPRTIGTIRVVEKGERPRTVFMSETAVEAVQNYLRHRNVAGKLLFCNPSGKPMYLTAPTNMLAKIAKKAGIPDDEPTNPHAFRHAFALRQLDAGLSPELVAEWMGIDVLTLLKHYTVRDENRLRRLYATRAV